LPDIEMIGALMSADFRSVPRRAADCLKVCYKLRERGERISTSAMRDRSAGSEISTICVTGDR